MKYLALLLALSAPLGADRILASFEKGINSEAAGRNIEYFSDRDESSASKTQILGQPLPAGAKGKGFRLKWRVVENPTLGYQYAGFAIPMEGKSLAGDGALTFQLSSPDGTVPPLAINLSNQGNDRDKLPLFDYVKALPKGKWVKVSVPLKDFKVLRSPEMLEQMGSVAFSFESGQGSLDFDEIAVEGSRGGGPAVKAAIPPRVRPVWKKGHVAWCYHDKDWNIARILKYNQTAPKGRKILYVFPWTGSYTFKPGGQTQLDWEEGEALYYHQKLSADKEVEIHPIIDAAAKGFENLTDKEIDDLARLTAQKVNARKEFVGLQLDIEPHNSLIHKLFAALRKYTKKPITIAVGRWSPETFRYVDGVALMMYDLSDSPQGFGRTAHKKLYEFMRDAKAAGGQAWVGMPAVATHSEYTHKIRKDDGHRVESGHTMEQYMEWAFKGVQKYCVGEASKEYVGMGVWGLLGGKAVGGNHEPYGYYPFEISEASWSYFRKPVE